MTDGTMSLDDEAVTRQQALVSLYARSGALDALDPERLLGFRPVVPSDALRALSGVPKDVTANSAPVAILYDLAREHYPDRDPEQDEYRHMVSIEAGGAKLTTREISVSVQALDDGTYGVRLQTANTSLAPGLYVGRLTTPEGATLAQVQLYMSRATGA